MGTYFTQWGIYGRAYKVKDLAARGGADKLTFLNYAFGNVYDDGKCNIITRTETGNGDGGDAWADYQKGFAADESVDGIADTWDQKLKGNFNQLKELKAKYPKIKIFISLGGWTWSKNFGKFAATDSGRQTMVKSCIDLYLRGNMPVADGVGGAGVAEGIFDGIDIDWEYPGGGGMPYNHVDPNDKRNFTLLMAEFRRQLDNLGTEKNRRFLLTSAIGSGVDKIRNTEPGQYAQYMDWVNVMTYDFFGAWDATGPTNFHNHLYYDPASGVTGDRASYNIDSSITELVNQGFPKSKLLVGVGFYGRGWRGVAAGPNGDGLYQSASAGAPGTYETGIEDYKVLKNKSSTRRYHPITKQLYMYDGNEFWSYDDQTTIRTKIQYVNTKGLGGVFSWSLDGDDSSATLLKTTGEISP